MTGLHGGLGVHTAVLHPPRLRGWLASARDRDLRLQTAAHVMNIVSASDPGTIVAFPAGFLRARRIELVDELAEQMRLLAQQNQVALTFGVELADDEVWAPIATPPRTFAYLCDGGRRVLWPTARDDVAHGIRGHRVAVLAGREIFRRDLRARLVKSPPSVVLVLTNLGPTGRWLRILGRLGRIAPTIVVGESTTGGVPDWAEPPRGWRREPVSTTDLLTVLRYEPEPSPIALHPALLRHVGGETASVKD